MNVRTGVFVVGMGVCVASVLAAPPASTSRYADKTLKYSFQPPAGWKRKTDLPRPIVAYIGPAEQGFASNFSVNLFSQAVKATEANEKKFLASIRKEYAKYGTMSPVQRIRLGGRPARTWRVKLKLPYRPPLENRQVLCLYNNRAYELTFTTLTATRKQYDPVCDKILASFRFEK